MELFATVMAYGSNIGLNNMAKNTTYMNAKTLDTTANWYFSLENLSTNSFAITGGVIYNKRVNLPFERRS